MTIEIYNSHAAINFVNKSPGTIPTQLFFCGYTNI